MHFLGTKILGMTHELLYFKMYNTCSQVPNQHRKELPSSWGKITVHRTSSSNNKRTRSKAFTLRWIWIKTNTMHHQETLNKQRPDTYHVLDRGPIDLLCFLLIYMLCLLVTNINLNLLKTKSIASWFMSLAL